MFSLALLQRSVVASRSPISYGRGWRRPGTDLTEKPEVVTTRPVLHDLIAVDTPDMDEGPCHPDTSRLGPLDERHGRRLVHTPHRHVLHHQLTVCDEMVLLHVSVAEVVTDGLEDLAQSVATLGPRSMVNHVDRYELVEHAQVSGALASKELLYHRFGFCHPFMVPAGLDSGHQDRDESGNVSSPFQCEPKRQLCIRAAAVKTRRLCLYQHLERFDVFHPHRHAFRYAVGPDLVCSLASRTLGIEEQQRSTSIAVSGPKPTAGLEASELSCARRDHVGQNLTDLRYAVGVQFDFHDYDVHLDSPGWMAQPCDCVTALWRAAGP